MVPTKMHYFCDNRCWRCSQSAVCSVFAKWSPRDQSSGIHTPGLRVASVMAVSLEVTLDALVASETVGSLGKLSAAVAPKAVELSEADHELIKLGAAYAQLAYLFLRRDGRTTDAAARLDETLATVASKTFRAVTSVTEEDDATGAQCDSNGSAKVALLLIAESRLAWATFGSDAHEFLELLRQLEVALTTRFPAAMSFVREGFDTIPAGTRIH